MAAVLIESRVAAVSVLKREASYELGFLYLLEC